MIDDAVALSVEAEEDVMRRPAAGQVRQAISVVKKRTGRHEKTVRELRVEPPGLRVGRQLTDFTGVLTGGPVYTGGEPLLSRARGGTDGAPVREDRGHA